ncbi:major facilitator superfamily domain-containing protein [Mycena floridula]|nr:major facilitator superfamily domain-containing protein [Mycena floridula]
MRFPNSGSILPSIMVTESRASEKNSNEPVDVATLSKDPEDQLASRLEQLEGVSKIEALFRVFTGWKIWLLYVSIALLQYVYTLSRGTTYVYLSYATSAYSSHAIIGTISVVVGIMSGVAQPFIARLADLSSRPTALAIGIFLYAVGYIVVACSKTVNDVCGGQVIYAVGDAGVSFLISLLIADITSLEWRGFANGLASLPWVVNTFVAGYISTGIAANTANGWRWGYGMFTILIPVLAAPVLVVLFWAEWKAKRLGVVARSSPGQENKSFRQRVLGYLNTMDALGLLLVGTSFTLILLPFTLYTTAKDGWKNPSLIAMFVVGGILMFAFVLWEMYGTSHPMMPRRVINRSFVCSVIIDILYYLSGYLSDTYYWSWVYVVKDWDLKNYTYFSNTETIGLCVFGFVAGLIQRATHRYKYLQLTGLCIRVIGMGLNFYAVKNSSDAVLVSSRIIMSMGGSFSVIGSQVATQASVPHQDMALAMSLLALLTSLGGGIGSAIAAAIWNQRLPQNLNKYLGDSLNATQIEEIFGSITVARLAEPRDLVIKAYNDTAYYLFLPALIITILPIGAGLLTSNFYLGKTHNAVENKEVYVVEKENETMIEKK